MSRRPLSAVSQTDLEQTRSSTGPPSSISTGHYRPFSTLAHQLQSIDSAILSHPRLGRSASVGGLHRNMGLQFGSRGRKDHFYPNLSATLPDGSSSLRMTKKRSIPSIFTVSDVSSNATPTPPSINGNLDDSPVIDISKKHVSFEEPESTNQFVPKNIWAKRHNMKLHPYQKQVPYMQAYDPLLLESDRYTDLLLQRLTNGSPSFHDYGNNPPAMVLDLGCGPGYWISHAAEVWLNTEFTGFDVVDVTIPSFETIENVRFVQGDFLNYKLPFPDNTFDFVRMSNLALCIPNDKWEFVIGQVYRVLMPGGRLEFINDQVYFPYGDGPKETETLLSAFRSKSFCDMSDDEGSTSPGRDIDDKPLAGAWRDTNAISLNLETGARATSPTPSAVLSESSTIRLVHPRREPSSLPLTPPHEPRDEPTRYGQLVPHTSDIRQMTTWLQRKPSKTNRSPTPLQASPKPGRDGTSGSANLPALCQKVLRDTFPPIRSITPSLVSVTGPRSSPTWSMTTTSTNSTSSNVSPISTSSTTPNISPGAPMNKTQTSVAWLRKAHASRNLEQLFNKMLSEEYGIHAHSAELVVDIMRKVFLEHGTDEAEGGIVREIKNFHIKLGPVKMVAGHDDVVDGKGRGSMEDNNETVVMDTSTPSDVVEKKERNAPVSTLKSRPWEREKHKAKERGTEKGQKQKDKEWKDELKEEQGRLNAQPDGVVTTATVTVSVIKAQFHPKLSNTAPLMPGLSAKAAGLLGIPYSELSAATLSASQTRALQLSSIHLNSGIRHSEALSAAAASTPTPSSGTLRNSPLAISIPSFASNATCGPVQHTGILIVPDTYIPMGAVELEMHACKYIHALLGCRPALEEFVAKFVDIGGKRYVGEEEFEDEIWEYECFRRARFNWPSEVADPYEDDPTNPNVYEHPSSTPGSSDSWSSSDAAGNLSSSTLEPPTTTGSISANGSYQTVPSATATNRPHDADVSKERSLRPTKSSTLPRTSSPKPTYLQSQSLLKKAKSRILPQSGHSRSATSPVLPRLRKVSSDESIDSMDENENTRYGKLEELVHLRTITVFEGVKES